jgi:hypothetical protein
MKKKPRGGATRLDRSFHINRTGSSAARPQCVSLEIAPGRRPARRTNDQLQSCPEKCPPLGHPQGRAAHVREVAGNQRTALPVCYNYEPEFWPN